jgi:C-terminal processing protease CtpA/Prc
MQIRMKNPVIALGSALALSLPLALTSPAVVGGYAQAGTGKDAHEGNYEKCPMDPEACKAKMTEEMSKRGWTGIEMDTDDKTGALTITKVVPGSPAVAGGLQPGDRVVAFNGVKVSMGNEDSWKEWRKAAPGQKVIYTIERNGQPQDVTVKLGAMPADIMASAIAMHMKEGHGIDLTKN